MSDNEAKIAKVRAERDTKIAVMRKALEAYRHRRSGIFMMCQGSFDDECLDRKDCENNGCFRARAAIAKIKEEVTT